MNPFEFVLIIIGMSFVMAIVIKKLELSHGRGGRRERGELPDDPRTAQENLRLRQEVSELKERIHVLERIATDKENSLAREIDSLRDR